MRNLSTSSSALNENFSSSRAIKDSDLNSQKTTKDVKLYKSNIWYVNNQRGCKRGSKIQPEERHCLPGGVLPLAAVYCHRVTLAAASDASLDNKMHTLIWQMCDVSEHVQCRQVKLGVFLFFLFPSGILEGVNSLGVICWLVLSRGWCFCSTARIYLWGLCSASGCSSCGVGAEMAFSLLFHWTTSSCCGMWKLCFSSSVSSEKTSLRWYVLKSLLCRVYKEWMTWKSQVLGFVLIIFWKMVWIATSHGFYTLFQQKNLQVFPCINVWSQALNGGMGAW